VFQRLRAALGDPTWGPAMGAVLRDDQFFPVQGHYASTWRADVSVAGGGALIEHSIHDLDALVWLLGPVEEVSAGTANFAGHPGIEDVVSVRLRHRAGTVSTLVSLWHQIMSRPSTRRLEVFCRDGLLWLDEDQVGPLHLEGPQGDQEIGPDAEFVALAASLPVRPDWQEPLAVYAAATLSFLDSVAAGQPPSPSVGDALEAQRLVDAVYRSADSGDSVTIALR
jgi:UDP-N-acetyl-2-amino-2-deoxyglucuronate dehydrogenase